MKCPKCRALLEHHDAHTPEGISKNRKPPEGAIGICAQCAQVLEYTSATPGGVRKITQVKLNSLSSGQLQQVATLRLALLQTICQLGREFRAN